MLIDLVADVVEKGILPAKDGGSDSYHITCEFKGGTLWSFVKREIYDGVVVGDQDVPFKVSLKGSHKAHKLAVESVDTVNGVAGTGVGGESRRKVAPAK